MFIRNLIWIILLVHIPFLGVAKEHLLEKKKIYVYKDEGVSKSRLAIKNFLIFSQSKYDIEDITAKEIIEGHWKKTAVCLIIPGGADIPYCKKLNGRGNQLIREFVENGGVYIGICAGGYYASSYIEFDKGGSLEVVGERELKFYPERMIGPLLASYRYNSEEGAKIAHLKFETGKLKGQRARVYFNGGGYFKNSEKLKNVKVIATYQNKGFKNKPAIVECKIGKGKAILTGVHPEIFSEYLEMGIEKEEGSLDKKFDYNSLIFSLNDRSHMVVAKYIFEESF